MRILAPRHSQTPGADQLTAHVEGVDCKSDIAVEGVRQGIYRRIEKEYLCINRLLELVYMLLIARHFYECN